MMLAIKEAVMDMSPYVRKTAAHAIPKLYRFDLILDEIIRFFNFESKSMNNWLIHANANFFKLLFYCRGKFEIYMLNILITLMN